MRIPSLRHFSKNFCSSHSLICSNQSKYRKYGFVQDQYQFQHHETFQQLQLHHCRRRLYSQYSTTHGEHLQQWTSGTDHGPTGSDFALDFFDTTYSDFYGASKWQTLRNGLLTSPKYVAFPNTFLSAEDNGIVNYYLEELGAINLRWLWESQSSGHMIQWPKGLDAFVFSSGSGLQFPKAKINNEGLSEFICMNGASLIPVLALNMDSSCDILDICAGPGTKSLLILMTKQYKSLTCNDLKQNRLNRVKQIFKAFTGNDSPKNVAFSLMDASSSPSPSSFSNESLSPNESRIRQYDRILVDVPCLNDRASLNRKVNNIFNESRNEERKNLVSVQKRILLSALKALKPREGSAVIYSTCTLHDEENDWVIRNVLDEIGRSKDLFKTDKKTLKEIMKPFKMNSSSIFEVSETEFGILIEPNVQSNFGPMFVNRLVKSSK